MNTDQADKIEHDLIHVLDIEALALETLAKRKLSSAIEAVDTMFRCQGKVAVAGTGKSGIIAQKISSTLSSSGTPSFFIRLEEAAHGDIGMLDKNDVLLVISNSGASRAFKSLLPFVRRLGIPVIAMVGTTNSDLGHNADIVIDVSVDQEACPLGLVPTASSTAALAMGDAMAIALLQRHGFTPEDYAIRHPGGSLGRRLKRVKDVMATGDRIPRVDVETPLYDVILELSEKRLGVVAIEDEMGCLVGVFSNGDLSRLFERKLDHSGLTAEKIMVRDPKTIAPDRLCEHAVHLMQQHAITALFVVDDTNRIIGIVHLHDLLKAEII